MTVGFNHVAIRVRDIEASARFLEAILGDSVNTIDLPGDTPTQRIKVIGPRGGVVFDLFSEGGAAPKDGPEFGLIHYCLGVEDVDAAYEAALAAGATHMEGPVTFEIEKPGEPAATVRAAYVYDPNGDVCEFVDHDWVDRL